MRVISTQLRSRRTEDDRGANSGFLAAPGIAPHRHGALALRETGATSNARGPHLLPSEAQFLCAGRGLPTSSSLQFPVDVQGVPLHRAGRDEELGRDFLVAITRLEQRQHLEFALESGSVSPCWRSTSTRWMRAGKASRMRAIGCMATCRAASCRSRHSIGSPRSVNRRTQPSGSASQD